MSCLYRALSAFHQGIATEQMRHILCDFLASDPQLGGEKASKVIPWETNKSLPQYLKIMKNQNQWGGAIEIKAYCDLFKKNVKVLSYPNNRTIEFLSNDDTNNRWITISWNGYHYEPITGKVSDEAKNLQQSQRSQLPKLPQLPQQPQQVDLPPPHHRQQTQMPQMPQRPQRPQRPQQLQRQRRTIYAQNYNDRQLINGRSICQCRRCRNRYGIR